MTSLSNIARPYALAAFEYARNKQTLSSWQVFLDMGAAIAKDAAVTQLLTHPRLSTTQLFELFHSFFTQLEAEQKNFLLLLTQRKRLIILPGIAEAFHAYHATFKKISNIRVITAVAMEASYQQHLMQVLSKRIQQAVTLQCEIEPSILGGAIIHIGDQVIDGSIRGKLTRLLDFSLR
jgi:F-type H+-transporting ATPase subunit delta